MFLELSPFGSLILRHRKFYALKLKARRLNIKKNLNTLFPLVDKKGPTAQGKHETKYKTGSL